MRPQIEFRIPISPTAEFYERIHLFCAALRRVEGEQAAVTVVVGDHADLSEVRRDNRWSANYHVQWHRVPDEIFAAYSYYGTADFRYLLPESAADVVVLADADTLLVQSVSEDLLWMVSDEPCIAGHMAHGPAWFEPVNGSEPRPPDLWPFLFRNFSIPWPEKLYRYSMDLDSSLPPVPAYYNLGFIALNQAALRLFREHILAVQDRLRTMIDSYMRCQIAVTLISYMHGIQHRNLPAIFNAANDPLHTRHNRVEPEQIKLLHYLRNDEIDRHSFLTEKRSEFFNAHFRNPLNQLLQRLARELLEEKCECVAHEPRI